MKWIFRIINKSSFRHTAISETIYNCVAFLCREGEMYERRIYERTTGAAAAFVNGTSDDIIDVGQFSV